MRESKAPNTDAQQQHDVMVRQPWLVVVKMLLPGPSYRWWSPKASQTVSSKTDALEKARMQTAQSLNKGWLLEIFWSLPLKFRKSYSYLGRWESDRIQVKSLWPLDFTAGGTRIVGDKPEHQDRLLCHPTLEVFHPERRVGSAWKLQGDVDLGVTGKDPHIWWGLWLCLEREHKARERKLLQC